MKLKTFGYISLAAGYIALIGGDMALGIRRNKIDSNIYEKAKIELSNAPGMTIKEYTEIATPKGLIYNPAEEAYKLTKIADSLKMKAAVERAYHEGAQMVRDSIKNASKTIR